MDTVELPLDLARALYKVNRAGWLLLAEIEETATSNTLEDALLEVQEMITMEQVDILDGE